MIDPKDLKTGTKVIGNWKNSPIITIIGPDKDDLSRMLCSLFSITKGKIGMASYSIHGISKSCRILISPLDILLKALE